MKTNKKIYITGATGLLGREIVSCLEESKICEKTFERIDLRESAPVSDASIWIHCAARVG